MRIRFKRTLVFIVKSYLFADANDLQDCAFVKYYCVQKEIALVEFEGGAECASHVGSSVF